MPLQNRCDPFGALHAVAARGTMMGNRGGKFHRPDRTLGKRRWASRHWIACELHWKGVHHEAMGQGYTSIFFLDEVTALAAGHRPCHFCRRAEARRFFALMQPPLKLDAADRLLHRQRLGERRETAIDGLPDGAMIDLGGVPNAVLRDALLRWTFGGYDACVPRRAVRRATLLTPPLIVAILARGYEPRWHPTAAAILGGTT